MKVIIITNLYPNNLEPSRATYNKYQFRELSKHCELKIIAPIAWTDRVKFWLRSREKIPASRVSDGIEVSHPTYFFPPRFFRSSYGICYFLSIFFVFRRLNKRFSADVVFVTWAFPDGYAAALLARISKKPFVLKVHGSDIHSIHGQLRKKLTAWVLCQSSKVFSVSKDLTKQVRSMGVPEKNVLTLYNGVDEDIFSSKEKKVVLTQLGLEGNVKRLLFVGNLKTVKGADFLADIISYTAKTHPDVHLYIIGQGVLERKIKEQFAEKNIENKVSFLGVQPHGQIALWMNAVDLLIVPSRNEGVPNVMLEAMSCGLPVVAARIGGVPEILCDGITGILCDEAQPSQLSNAVIRSLNRDWDTAAIEKLAKQYSWSNNINSILRQLNKIRSH